MSNEEKDGFEKYDIPTLKYFWQASPLYPNRSKSLHNFLRTMRIFSDFTDYELRNFASFLHKRNFSSGEPIFKEGDRGLGLYFIYSGSLAVYSRVNRGNSSLESENLRLVVELGKGEYLGELSLLEKGNIRNVSALANENTTLLAFFAPDLDDMIERYPVVAAKFLRGVCHIVSKRFNAVASELHNLRDHSKDREGL